ncbi:MAG: c-type cytochrome biogenesis protein CcmI [Pseudomonadota bacterium]
MDQTWLFWIIVVGLTLAVAAPLVLVLLRRAGGARSSAEFDIAVYRDQLKEVDRDVARGVITEDVAERTKVEISRRILDADKTRSGASTAEASKRLGLVATGLVTVVLLGGSVQLYRTLGAPGMGDLPLAERLEAAENFRANRPSQAAAEEQAATQLPPPPLVDPQIEQLVGRLRTMMESGERADDPRGWQLLAQNEAALGNYAAAHRAQARLLELVGDQAPGAAYGDLAEFYILAAGNYVSPEAESALREALQRDPSLPAARYYSGLMYAQTGRPDLAFNIWRHLLENTPATEPWNLAIRPQIEELAWRAGVDYTVAPLGVDQGEALRGPTAEDMAAAQDMDPDDRMAMIEGMVEGLALRLANEGGTGAEWARLISALGVLGQQDRAQTIYNEAKDTFAADPSSMEAVRAAAAQVGLEL